LLLLTKSVGTDPLDSKPLDEVVVEYGEKLEYCFTLENRSESTFTVHSLVDSHYGPIMTEFPYALAPGETAFVTAELRVFSEMVGAATWTAFEESTGLPLIATDEILVHVKGGGLTPILTETFTQTYTPTVTDTPTVTSTFTITNTPTVTSTPTITDTPNPTGTPTPTSTPSPTGTPTDTATPTATDTATPTASDTPTETETPTPTEMETPTETGTPTPTGTETPTQTETPTESPTPVPVLSADLEVQATDAPDPVKVGQILVYSISVRNLGPNPAKEVVLENRIPSSVSFLSASPGCELNGNVVSCSIGELAASMIKSVSVAVEVMSEVNLCGIIKTKSDSTDPNPLNNSFQTCTVGQGDTFHPADINEDTRIDPKDLMELLKVWKREFN